MSKPDRKRREHLLRAANGCARDAIRAADQGRTKLGATMFTGWLHNLYAACGMLPAPKRIVNREGDE